ncbi:hypothetical protein LP419_37660 [Massilia sp. H-1]|nr:hypothetical protein LP419_37660 [Massilia sp. H-1]
MPHAVLSLSDACRVWGQERPVTPATTWNAPVTVDAAKAALARDAYRCRFCGYRSAHNLVHHANDLHRDEHPDNLWTCDPLCHGWQHLGDMPEQFAVIAYLPGLSPADVNHLQRTLMVALHCGGDADKAAARDVLNWAASHRDYVTPAWGSSAPQRSPTHSAWPTGRKSGTARIRLLRPGADLPPRRLRQGSRTVGRRSVCAVSD